MNKLLFLTSIALFATAIIFRILAEQWTTVSVILSIVAGIIFLSWLIISLKKYSKISQHNSMKTVIKSFVKIIAVLIVLTLINFLAIRHPIRIDLTENQIFTLTPQSQEIAENLTKPLKVWIFNSTIDPETQTLLKNYQRHSKNFTYQLVDPNTKTNLTPQFKVKSVGETYLEYEGKKQRLNTSITPLGTNISETKLANAIAKIQQNKTFHIYFLQGHGEPVVKAIKNPRENPTESDFFQAINALRKRSYTVKPLNLATSPNIPQDADLIAIAKPLKKLQDTEVTTLQQYLKNGGNLLLMLMPNTDIGLNPIWQNWGIQLDNRLVINGASSDSPIVVVADNYGDHPITRNFDNGITIFPESRIIQTTQKDNITVTPLVITSENTWAESNLAQDTITFNPQEDIRGSLNIAIALTQENASRIVVFGNGNFATNNWFNQHLNSDLFLNTIEWLTGTEQDTLSIRPKEFTNRRINLTPLKAQLLNWLAIKIIPPFGFIIAAILWWKKR